MVCMCGVCVCICVCVCVFVYVSISASVCAGMYTCQAYCRDIPKVCEQKPPLLGHADEIPQSRRTCQRYYYVDMMLVLSCM